MKTIILYGLRRSGNHFLISLILQSYKNYVHINDTYLSYDKYIKYKNIKKDKNRIDRIYTGFKNVECVVISIENKIINSKEIDKFKYIDNCYFLMLLRCPYSHFSSVWKQYEKNIKKLIEIVILWKLYAKKFISDDNKIIKILYDKLSTNKEYRINTLKKIDIEYNIYNITDKQIMYQESSFNDKNKAKQVYSTIENCIYKDDDIFLKLIEDKEINNIWKKIINRHNFKKLYI